MFDETKIETELSDLSFEKQLIFAASCCERLLPFYYAFTKVNTWWWGNLSVMQDILNGIWEVCHSEEISNQEISEFIKTCEALTPDSEDFTSPYTSQAIDVCSAFCSTLEFCLTKEVSLLRTVARNSYDAVEIYLQMVNDPILGVHAVDVHFDKWIETAPLLLAEIKHQQSDIKLITESKVDSVLIDKIKESSSKSGVNPEKRGLL